MGVLAALGAAGCSLAKDEATGSSPDEVVSGGDPSVLLKSTLVLSGGCTAAKVGPKQLLVSARCVSGNPAFAAGKVLTFTSASAGQGLTGPTDAGRASDAARDSASSDAEPASTDAGAPTDSGAREGGAADAGTSNPNARAVTIAEVKIHASFAAKCKPATADVPAVCDFDKIASSDSPDIAVILLEDDLTTVPTIPVDLDPVGQADPVYVVNGGCATLDARATALKTAKTIAVPAKSVNHTGSPYVTAPQLVTRLASSYLVTPGVGWRNTDPRFCKTDLGAPIFRAGSAAVVGVSSNYTIFAEGKVPVTVHHTRVDSMSRFKIGEWLGTLGVTTINTCSETTAGCVKNTYDGGTPEGTPTEGPGGGGTTVPGDTDGGRADAAIPPAPKGDGGEDEELPPAAEEPSGPRQETLPSEEPDTNVSDEEVDYSDAAAPKKKKKADEGGCSAAPGGPAPTGEMFLGFALALGIVAARRRRRA